MDQDDLVRGKAAHVVSACELLNTASKGEMAAAESMAIDAISRFLASLGFGIHQLAGDLRKVGGQAPAFRINSSTDYVVRDVRRAAGLARAMAQESGVGLCTAEPLEEDPMGIILDLLELEVPPSRMLGAVDVHTRDLEARPLQRRERG